LKQIVSENLIEKGFSIILEPDFPPGEEINWQNYRPDIFGVLKTSGKTHYVIVECETRPNKERFANKKWKEIVIQPKLFDEMSLTLILAVPFGYVSKVTSFGNLWEIWQVNTRKREVIKILRNGK
jgi:hypothetical protein